MVAIHRQSGPAASALAPCRSERPWVTCCIGTKMVSTIRQRAAQLGLPEAITAAHRDRRHRARQRPIRPYCDARIDSSVSCQPHQLR
jgi:uncharacterized protein (DUF58 family)